MIKVVLDTNQIISALLKPTSNSARLLDLIEKEKLSLLISVEIVLEIRKVLQYPKIKKILEMSTSEIDNLLNKLLKVAVCTPGEIKIDIVKSDPTDNKFLECALEGNADFIITGDKDLLQIKSFKGIKIMNPADFLHRLTE